MATTSFTMDQQTASNTQILAKGLALLAILVLSGLALVINYWLGIGFFFLSLLAFLLGFKFEKRNFFLLLYAILFVIAIVGSVVQPLLLTTGPGTRQLTQSSAVANAFLGSYEATLLTSILIGVIASLSGVVVPFLLLVAIAVVGVLKWHKYEGISFTQLFSYLARSILGVNYFSVVVEEGELKGKEEDIKLLEGVGGPGWLKVYPGQVVVLHRGGKITRVVAPNSVMLEPEEKIKVIVPLTGQGGENTIENVLTRDRIPITLTIAHKAQVEPAAETEERLGEDIRGDKIIGDEYDKCYERIAKLVAARAPKVWDSMKGAVASNVKDVIMTCDFADLFSVNGAGKDLEIRVNNRKIAEIERFVLERAKESGPGKGIVLRGVDISEVHFPEEIQVKITKQVTALIEEEIKRTEARVLGIEAKAKSDAQVIKAESELTAAESEASAIKQLANAKAYAIGWAENVKIAARVEYFRRVLQMLQDNGQSDDTIGTVLQNLTASAALEDELRRLLQIAIHYVKGEFTGGELPGSTWIKAKDL